jgi:hypothetical protein
MIDKAFKTTIQRDASFVGTAIFALVIVSFAGLAIASAVMDLATVGQ